MTRSPANDVRSAISNGLNFVSWGIVNVETEATEYVTKPMISGAAASTTAPRSITFLLFLTCRTILSHSLLIQPCGLSLKKCDAMRKTLEVAFKHQFENYQSYVLGTIGT